MEGNLFYSRSTDFNVNLNNIFIVPSRLVLEKTVEHHGLVELTHKINHHRKRGRMLSLIFLFFLSSPAAEQDLNLWQWRWWWWVRTAPVAFMFMAGHLWLQQRTETSNRKQHNGEPYGTHDGGERVAYTCSHHREELKPEHG